MQNIFIDTSVFVSENFLHGNHIKGFIRLIEGGHLKLVMPLITINEVKSQFGKRAEQGVILHNTMLKDRDLFVLKNIPGGEEKLSKFPKIDDIKNEFNKKFDKLISDLNTTVIPYPTLDTTELFDKYFNNKKPFGKADKKHEFPDAIALESLIQWCEANKQQCIVLAGDKDLSRAPSSLQVETDYKKYLTETLGKILEERKQIVDDIYKRNTYIIEQDVQRWIRTKLDDTSLYYDQTNWMEVHDLEISLVAVKTKEYQITTIDDDIITAEVIVKAHVKIELVIDDESSMYRDPDDKAFYYMDTTNLEIEQDIEFPVTVVFHVINKEDFDPNVDIVEYNEGNGIELESERNQYY